MDNYCVIMAGGSGQRFWPASRRALPKQLLSIEKGVTLVQATLDRVPEAIGPAKTLVITNASQVAALKEQVDLPAENIIAEPLGRDTAPCIGLAARIIAKRSPKGVMAVMAADHVIAPRQAFQNDLTRAMAFARREDAIVTLGITPSHPATGYGYIALGEDVVEGFHPVTEFKEKPSLELAEEFLRQGGYLWNSGIFIWPARRILDEIARHLPELSHCLDQLGEEVDKPGFDAAMEAIFPTCPKISIDHGILEHARGIYCLEASFSWDDVGSLAALARHNPQDSQGNTLLGHVVLHDASRCIADNRGDGLLALLGVEDLIVVRTPDAVLVARRGREEDVKALVQKLTEQGEDEYL